MSKRGFYELRDGRGKLVGELSAINVELLEHADQKTTYKIESELTEGSPILTLPAGFTIRRIA